MSVPELFDRDFKYRLLTPNIERALSLQRIWKFGLLVPYIVVRGFHAWSSRRCDGFLMVVPLHLTVLCVACTGLFVHAEHLLYR